MAFTCMPFAVLPSSTPRLSAFRVCSHVQVFDYLEMNDRIEILNSRLQVRPTPAVPMWAGQPRLPQQFICRAPLRYYPDAA